MDENPASQPGHTPISFNLACHRCAYNLRGLQRRGRCPECAAPIEVSVAGDALQFADPVWLANLALGARWAKYTVTGVVVAVFSATAIDGIFTGKLQEKVAEILDDTKSENSQRQLSSQQSPLADRSETLKRLDLDPDVYMDLLDDLVKRLSAGIQEVENLLNNNDLSRIATCLTALFGASQSLGALRSDTSIPPGT